MCFTSPKCGFKRTQMWLLQQRAEAFLAACAPLVADGARGAARLGVQLCESTLLAGDHQCHPTGLGEVEMTSLRASRVRDEPSRSAGGVVRAFLRIAALVEWAGSKCGG
ncbi:unnamed protein product [Coccothraustes coccothraustes]